ncbi:MAG: ATP-binding protein [Planctomycetes bacterium]|nr:ATP-binding protein [Planctomycetota bacterium]
MNVGGDQIVVRSHVARDLLQNAALFKTDRLVVWEYVSNGLQYVDPGVNPVVRVSVDSKRKRIEVSDNGRGMDWTGLQNFFIMHGENVDRIQGKPGRGRFGTRKSAAFGIAAIPRVTTVQGGRRSRVELRQEDVKRMESGAEIPVRCLERAARVNATSGTTIEIEGVYLRSLDQAGVIRYIERHLARWPKNCTVYVNNHECEFAEPPVAFERRFRAQGDFAGKLGDVELLLKVAKAPLAEDFRGVGVYSNGVWHETTLAGSEGKDMCQYILGEIDVPRLDGDTSPIPPFDLSRSMRLNPQNEVVHTLYAFIGQKVEEVRRELVELDRKRRLLEEERKLRAQASDIARLIDEDFNEFRARVAKVRAKAAGAADLFSPESTDVGEDDLAPGSTLPVEPQGQPSTAGATGVGDGSASQGHSRSLAPGGPDAPRRGQPAGGFGGKRASGGGFSVKFERHGAETHRATYVRDERAIYVNLDHPQLAAALKHGSIDDLSFRRLANEVAFAEYAVALASELAARDEYMDPSDPIVDIREALNRLARRAVALYSA